ncbi:hypothetical protein DFQ01_12631 [Paenibacillus cellulosilyticus]|uniref:Uncharacterized protein n=1 Tax=Paenibacillus cellulosilyticus TaxID=375489 RepID=A0A2V2YME5_9BACL|nr:hypothetical protein DFQ01_12631 [Paenibacillus cellulosilyticus]
MSEDWLETQDFGTIVRYWLNGISECLRSKRFAYGQQHRRESELLLGGC